MELISIKQLEKLVKAITVYSAMLTTGFKQVSRSLHRKLQFENPQLILKTASKANQREFSQGKEDQQSNNKVNATWMFGEFKVFGWTLIYLSITQDVQINDFTDYHFKKIGAIFITKTLNFLKYESKVFIHQKQGPSQYWGNEEIDQLLLSIKKNKGSTILWREVSYDLYTASNGKYFRTLNQCREKWRNHLDPQVNKDKWTLEEDLELFNVISHYGCKWSRVSKSLQINRTQHMVKNRYHWYIRKIGSKKANPSFIISYIKKMLQARAIKKQADVEDIKQDNDNEIVMNSERPQKPNSYLQKSEQSKLSYIENQYQLQKNKIQIKCQEQKEIMYVSQPVKREDQQNPIIYHKNTNTLTKIGKLKIQQREYTMKRYPDLFYYPFMEMPIYPQYMG